MPFLNWNKKQDFDVKPLIDAYAFTTLRLSEIHQEDSDISISNDQENSRDWNNLLIQGDNKQVMLALLDKFKGKINLVYIDPPFFTGGDFSYKTFIGKGNSLVSKAYSDSWEGGINAYLNFIHERLFLIRKLLSNNGSIYLHLDWHVSHYIKILMDEVFGSDNFKNEIIWAYPAASAKTRQFFIRSYDTIFFYTKSKDYTFRDFLHDNKRSLYRLF
jgi:adenine specific DNA methylase Mod